MTIFRETAGIRVRKAGVVTSVRESPLLLRAVSSLV